MKAEYITFHDAARLLGKSRASIYRLMVDGLLTPHYAPAKPRTPLFRLEEVKVLNLPAAKETPYNKSLHAEAAQRDGRKCVVCGEDRKGVKIFAHHIHPVEQGGCDTLDNLISLCYHCHRSVHGTGKALRDKGKKHGTLELANWLLESVKN